MRCFGSSPNETITAESQKKRDCFLVRSSPIRPSATWLEGSHRPFRTWGWLIINAVMECCAGTPALVSMTFGETPSVMNSPENFPSLVIAEHDTDDGVPLYGFENEHKPFAFR